MEMINIAYNSNVKYCDLEDFLKAKFVDFRCQKYVKKGYLEMRVTVYLEPEKSVLDRSILHYSRLTKVSISV